MNNLSLGQFVGRLLSSCTQAAHSDRLLLLCQILSRFAAQLRYLSSSFRRYSVLMYIVETHN